jgi:hypothetical protein
MSLHDFFANHPVFNVPASQRASATLAAGWRARASFRC